MEKRGKKRFGKRLPVRFGKDRPDTLGFTTDLSDVGMFIKTNRMVPPGSKLKIQITLPNETVIDLTGEVIWGKAVPPCMARFVKKNGLGVALLDFPQSYLAFLNAFKKPASGSG